MTERTLVICDKCNKEIANDEKYLNAGTYGIHLHLTCLNQMPTRDFIIMLDIECKVMTGQDWATAVKGPSYFRKEYE